MHKKLQTNKRNHFYGWLIGIFVIFLLIISAFWPTNYYLEAPGQALPVGNFIQSQQKKPKNLYLVTVSIGTHPASVLEYLWSYTQKFVSRTPSSTLLGKESTAQYNELQNWYMATSEQDAVYYAAERAHLRPRLHYHGVYVMAVQSHSSFRHKLRIGDTVLGANHHRFHSTEQMMTYLQKQKIGRPVQLLIFRNKREKRLQGKIVKVKGTGRSGIGIELVDHLSVTTKPKLQIKAGNIGGPSAGLMFTLESYEIFTHQNLTGGKRVAGTGTIAPNGRVGIIGGVDKKVVAASRAGAKIFFAPTDRTGVKKNQTNYMVAKRTAKRIHTRMKIVPVADFNSALDYLEKHK